MAGAELEIAIKQIEPGDRLSGLSLGHEDFTPLKTFLQKRALKYEDRSLSRTYGAFSGPKVVGYVTLTCGEIVSDDATCQLVDDVEYPYNHYPAVKVARLAVDQRMQGKGLGEKLVRLAIGQAKRVICPAVGCRFVTVDAKRQSVGFYIKCGFTILDTQENHDRPSPVMWIDLNKVSRF